MCFIWWYFCKPYRASGLLQSSCSSCWMVCIFILKPFQQLPCMWFVCHTHLSDSITEPYVRDPSCHSLVAPQNVCATTSAAAWVQGSWEKKLSSRYFQVQDGSDQGINAAVSKWAMQRSSPQDWLPNKALWFLLIFICARTSCAFHISLCTKIKAHILEDALWYFGVVSYCHEIKQ